MANRSHLRTLAYCLLAASLIAALGIAVWALNDDPKAADLIKVVVGLIAFAGVCLGTIAALLPKAETVADTASVKPRGRIPKNLDIPDEFESSCLEFQGSGKDLTLPGEEERPELLHIYNFRMFSLYRHATEDGTRVIATSSYFYENPQRGRKHAKLRAEGYIRGDWVYMVYESWETNGPDELTGVVAIELTTGGGAKGYFLVQHALENGVTGFGSIKLSRLTNQATP